MNNQDPYMNKEQPNELEQQLEEPQPLPTEIRRKYPKDIKDRKSEWVALEHHKKDVSDEIKKNEMDIRNIKQKELITELDRKMLLDLESKQKQLMQKAQEADNMMQQRRNYEESLKKLKQDQKLFQNNLGNFYQEQRSDQAQKEYQYKQQKLDWENKLLEYNRQRLESEQRRKKEHKDYLIQEKDADIQRAQDKKSQQFQSQEVEKQQYRDLMRQNAEREITKEENYRNFYKLAAENQNNLHQLHYQNVMKPLVERQMQLEQIIQKNVDYNTKQRAEDELNRIQTRQKKLTVMRDKNLGLITEHQYQQELGKIEKDQKVKDRLQDLQNYQQYLEFKRKEKCENQTKYKSFLEQQVKEKSDLNNNELRMTRQEKGFNKLDLQAYKHMDAGLYAMLPGWNPQVGQLPPRQNRERMQEIILQKARQMPSALDNPNILDPKINKVEGVISKGETWEEAFNKASQKDLTKSSVPNLQQYQKIGEPAEKYSKALTISTRQSPKAYNTGNNFQNIFTYGHNPITNPMPFNIQNPYIAREFNKVSSKVNIFSQTGQQITNQQQQ